MANLQAALDRVVVTSSNLAGLFQDIIDGKQPNFDEYEDTINAIEDAQECLSVDILAQYYFKQQTRALNHRPTTQELEHSWQQFQALQDRVFNTVRLPRKMPVVHQKMLAIAASYELGF